MASLRKHGKYWYGVYYVDGKQVKRSLKTTNKKMAERLIRKIEDDLAAGRFNLDNFSSESRRLEEFLIEAYQFSRNNKSPRTAQREHLIFRHFLGFVGDVRLNEITPKLLEAYKHHLLHERHYKPSGVNIELRHLSAAFSLAVKYDYLEKNPFKKVERMRVPKTKPLFFTKEQARQLLDYTRNKAVYPHILIALNTGARVGEVCTLRWEKVDLEQRILRVFGKGAKERTIPIPGSLHQYLLQIRKAKGLVVKGSHDTAEVSRQFRKAADALGFHEHTFHTLRHTYASWLVQDGVSLKVIQELMGHADIQTTMIYAHLAPDSRFEAIAVIDNHLNISGPAAPQS